MKKLISIVTKPVILIIVISITLLSLIFYGLLQYQSANKRDMVNSLNISEITSDEDTGKINDVILADDKDAIEKEYDSYKSDLEDAANSEKEITDMIDKYYNARYSYSGNIKDNKSEILNAIEEISTSEFKKSVEKGIDKEKTKDSKIEIIRKYLNGRSVDDLEASVNELSYVYIVNINGKQRIDNIDIKSDAGQWKINSVTTIANA